MIADLRLVDSPKNFDTRESVRLKSGDSVTFEFLLLNGDEIADVSKLGSLTLEILDVGEINTPSPRSVKLLASKSISNSEINFVSGVDDFKNGNCHASFSFNQSETSFSDGHKWINLVGYTNAGEKSTFAQGWIDVFEQYSADDVDFQPPLAENQFLRRDYADAIYLNASKNLSDVEDINRVRDNLDVYSRIECDSQIDSISMRVDELEKSKKMILPRGCFYLEDGEIKMRYSGISSTYSHAFTMSMSRKAFSETTLNDPIFGTLENSDSPWGWSVARTSEYNASIFYNYNHPTLGLQNVVIEINSTYTNMLFDGNHHACVLISSGTSLAFYVDTIEIISESHLNKSTAFSTNFFFKGKGAVFSRIAVFNFDMSEFDAPYCVEDYVNGMSIYPALFDYIEIDNTSNWRPKLSSSYSLSKEDDYLKFNMTSNYSSYYVIALVDIPRQLIGKKLSVYFDSYESNADIGDESSVAFSYRYDNGTEYKNTLQPNRKNDIILKSDADQFYLYFVASNRYMNWTVGDWVKINGLIIVSDGVQITLSDSLNLVQIADKSKNKNHAMVYGNVLADNLSNPALCSDSTSFSWAGTMTTQRFANSDSIIPANSIVTAYARADAEESFLFQCANIGDEYIVLPEGELKKIGEWVVSDFGAFTAVPSHSYTGKLEVFLKVEKF